MPVPTSSFGAPSPEAAYRPDGMFPGLYAASGRFEAPFETCHRCATWVLVLSKSGGDLLAIHPDDEDVVELEALVGEQRRIDPAGQVKVPTRSRERRDIQRLTQALKL